MDVILNGKLTISVYILLSSSVLLRHNGSILFKEREKNSFSLFLSVSLKETEMSPENDLASLLCVGEAEVLPELETQYRTSEVGVHCMGNREQKAYNSAVCFQGVRRQANEPEMHMWAAKFMTTSVMA